MVNRHPGSSPSRVEDVGLSDYEFTMSLVVRHPDIDPAQITRALALQPDHIWRTGEQRLDEVGTALGGSHRGSYWICEITARPRMEGERPGMGGELSRVLDVLRRSMGFMQDLHHGGGATELVVTIFARGDFHVELLPEESSLLGRLGVAMTINIKPYPARKAS